MNKDQERADLEREYQSLRHDLHLANPALATVLDRQQAILDRLEQLHRDELLPLSVESLLLAKREEASR